MMYAGGCNHLHQIISLNQLGLLWSYAYNLSGRTSAHKQHRYYHYNLHKNLEMSFFSKNTAQLAILLALLAPIQTTAAEPIKPAAPPTTSVDNTKGIFVILTDEEPMTQMMALVLSTQTFEQGKSLQILLCGQAGKLAVKNSKQTMFKPINKSPQMLLAELIARGVQVEVCPLFLPNFNMSESQLITGVTIAKPPVIARKMRAEEIKLVTF
jgi:predicted peroxiredoxin